MNDKVWVVNRGVDTLVINGYSTDGGKSVKRDIDDSLAVQLDEWKKAAQEMAEPYATPWVFEGACLHMQPNGAGRGQWPWMLKSKDITLYLSRGRWNGVASVRFTSEFLWSSQGVLDAIVKVDAFLYDIFQQELFLQLSEVHLCADIVNWKDVESLDRRQNFVSRSRKRGEHHEPDWGYDLKVDAYSYGLCETGFDFSKRGPLSCTIYDKLREMKASGKEWFADLWRGRGWNELEEGHVWRVEFKFKREALHELKQEDVFHGIEDVYDLPGRLPLLWTYAAGHVGGGDDGLPDGWLRCVLPNGDKNRSRWPTHPAWEVVQGAFRDAMEMPDHFGKVVRKRREERNIEKGLEAIIGYATSLSAWIGGDLADPDNDLSVFLHWLAIHGEKYLERKQWEFGTEVQRKRIKFGLQAS